jgi:hypothetical protein
MFACLATFLVCYFPPLAVLNLALPCYKSEILEVFTFFEKDPEQRADSFSGGHVTVWYEIGWMRAFLLCCILTCFGFFPGVFFAAFVTGLYLWKSI